MTEKQILEQIRIFNDKENYGETAEFIEKLGKEEQTPTVLCELARAYNNLAVFDDPEKTDLHLLKTAVEILNGIEEEFPENDHVLNYRMGYALFYLDRAGEALERFNRALIQEPDDEDTKEFIEMCRNRLTLPMFDRSFRQRIEDGWARFAEGEAELRRLISEKADSDEITDHCNSLLDDTFAEFCFEVGFNGEKYDLILSPDKDKYMLYLFDEFRKHAPQSVTEHWNILLGRQPAHSPEEFALGFNGHSYVFSDVTVRIDRDENGCTITGYCDQLAQVLKNNRNEAFCVFDILLDMAWGEIVNMRYVDTIDIAEEPFDGIPLIKLSDEMKNLFGEKEGWDSVESYLDTVSGYEMQPHEFAEDEYPTPRLDAFVGFSSIPQLMFDYVNGEYGAVNKADNDGVAAGFIFFPVHVFEEDETAKRGEKILNFRDDLEQYIKDKANNSVVFIGGASGIDNCYLDFLAWDIRDVLDAAAEFFANQNTVPWAFYQSYRTDVKLLALMYDEDE